MKQKLLDIYEKFANYLCSFSSDKYVHLLVGLLISFIVSTLIIRVLSSGCVNIRVNAQLIGLFVAILVGCLKEILDKTVKHEEFDLEDILFTTFGALIGILLFTI